MTFGKTALRCWLPAAALLLALLCPLPVAAARAGTAIPVSVRTDGAAADAVYTVELTPLDAAPAPVQRALTVKNGGTVYFTGFAFDEPGDYRYLVAERSGGAAHTTYDTHSYTVTVRVTGRPDGGLAAGLWAVRSGKTATAAAVRAHARAAVAKDDMEHFIALVFDELHALHPGNAVRFGIRPLELAAWLERQPRRPLSSTP